MKCPHCKSAYVTTVQRKNEPDFNIEKEGTPFETYEKIRHYVCGSCDATFSTKETVTISMQIKKNKG